MAECLEQPIGHAAPDLGEQTGRRIGEMGIILPSHAGSESEL